MHLNTPLQKEVLVDHILKQGLRETIGLQRNRVRTRDFLDDLGVAQQLKPCLYFFWIDCRTTEKWKEANAHGNEGTRDMVEGMARSGGTSGN